MNRQPATLHDYQKRAVNFIKTKKKCAVFLNIGFGKTLTSLTAIQELKEAWSHQQSPCHCTESCCIVNVAE